MKEQLPRTCIPCEKIENDCYDWYERHASRLALVNSGKKFPVVLIGDSITHFWEPGPVSHGAENWQECMAKYDILNLGFGFDRTQNVLWRLDHGELDHQNPAMIVLNIGTNQFSITQKYDGDTPEAAFLGVKAVIEKLRSMFPDAEIVVMAVFPRGGTDYFFEHINGLNKLVREYVRGKEKLRFLDISSDFLHADGRSLKTELYCDGSCHPNSDGYRFWFNALEKDLQRIFGK